MDGSMRSILIWLLNGSKVLYKLKSSNERLGQLFNRLLAERGINFD